MVPHSSILYIFHVGSTRGQCAPHDHQPFPSLCVGVCVRVQRTHDLVQCACVHWHAKNTYMYVLCMWGSMHLNARERGGGRGGLLSGDWSHVQPWLLWRFISLITGSSPAAQDNAEDDSRSCLLLFSPLFVLSLFPPPRRRGHNGGGSVKDVHIRECSDQH